ncbi:MAG: SRPBCC domain-containing protein [Phycisphaerales bacterium]|nr:SRPBCC domain-containing protein [Phycisphaerales bacterium]
MIDTVTVEATIHAPISDVWRAYVTPADVEQWNAATAQWHTPSARVDLRVGGEFCYRMEAKDGSFGFDFAGVFTTIVHERVIEYTFGERHARVDFIPEGRSVKIRVSFEVESTHSVEQQRSGWQAILDNFKRHVERIAR